MGKQRQIISIGDIFYYLGRKTKLKVIENPDNDKPTCEVLECTKNSKFNIGDQVKIDRRSLFKRKGRKGKR